MLGATRGSESNTTTALDPSMEQLAPRPGRARNRLLLFVAVVALVAAVFSPNVLRPSLNEHNSASGGSWHALPRYRQVITTTSLSAQTWPRVEVHSIDDVHGAQLVSAWIVDESVVAAIDDAIDESSYESGLSYITEAMPGLDTEHDALPQSVDRGDTAVLIALWDIGSCDDLDVTPVSSARVETRTIIRTRSTSNLPEIAAPGFDVELLRRTGTCA